MVGESGEWCWWCHSLKVIFFVNSSVFMLMCHIPPTSTLVSNHFPLSSQTNHLILILFLMQSIPHSDDMTCSLIFESIRERMVWWQRCRWLRRDRWIKKNHKNGKEFLVLPLAYLLVSIVVKAIHSTGCRQYVVISAIP